MVTPKYYVQRYQKTKARRCHSKTLPFKISLKVLACVYDEVHVRRGLRSRSGVLDRSLACVRIGEKC